MQSDNEDQRPLRGTARVNYAKLHAQGFDASATDEKELKEVASQKETAMEVEKEEEYAPPVISETDSDMSVAVEEIVSETKDLVDVSNDVPEKQQMKPVVSKKK